MAKVSTIKQAVLLCRAANVTPFIWGNRGLGKSSLVKQLAAENGWGFIDLRCSQLEASDIRGLPNPGPDGRTHYLPPADMPIGDLTTKQVAERLGDLPTEGDLEAKRLYDGMLQAMQNRFQNGILFLDEVNRAQDDVLQAIFQLILDRRVGQYVLPPGWCVVAAGNFMEGYMVSGFNDAAFLDRMCHMVLSGGETTLEEWISYMSSVHGGTSAEVIEFASQNMQHLDGNVQGELGFLIQPSRRSWDAVVRVQKEKMLGDFSEEAYLETLSGLVGRDLAIAFTRYSCPVKPSYLIESGVQSYEKKLEKLNRNQLTGLMWGLVSYCLNRIDEDKIANVCLDFASWMLKHANDKDIVVAFCRALVAGKSGSNNHTKSAAISNPQLAKIISKLNKESGKVDFIDRLTERPELQEMLAKVSWGIN